MAWDKLNRKEIAEMQNKLLRNMIQNQLAHYSPFYKRLFREKKIDPASIRTTEDLKKIPFISKEDIAPTVQNPKKHTDFILQPTPELIKEHYPKTALAGKLVRSGFSMEKVQDALRWEYYPVHIHFTTGRSANPTAFVYTKFDIENLKTSGERLFQVFNLKKTDVVINGFPYAPHLAFWQVYYAAEKLGMMCLHTGGGKVMGSNKIITAIANLKPQALTFIPGYAYYLFRKAAEMKKDFSSVHTVIFGGERVPPGLKTKVVELLTQMGAKNPRVLATYAMTESRVAWGECHHENSTGYHLYPDMEFFEIIDPNTGERVNEGEPGEIVYSALNWRGSCVLRYRTGDLAKEGIHYDKCPNCGRTCPRIGANIQRVSDMKEFHLTKVKGSLVNLNIFYPMLMNNPDILEWQVELRKENDDPYGLDELHLHLAIPPSTNFEELKRKLSDEILTEMEIKPTSIQLHDVNSLLDRLGMESETKEKRIVDNRPK
ncbi:MAG: AMP-binding protein [Thermoplasmata archaeon]